tara:strand:+ start:60 stop:620 length:561 start_codon:yes stop_codon:yes gene_type:complete
MRTENIEKYLESFGKQVANRAKGALRRKKGGGTALENSIKFDVVKTSSGYEVEFSMLDYGAYVDKGVSGTQVKRSYTDYMSQRKSSPFSYKNSPGSSQPPSKALDKWVVKNNLKGTRDKSGKFISRKSITFLVARSIGKRGIQGISFFQKPLSLGLKEFGSEFLEKLSLDIVDQIGVENNLLNPKL